MLKNSETNTDELAADICTICREARVNTKLISGCNHLFCRDCINRWFDEFGGQHCPTCKLKLKKSTTKVSRQEDYDPSATDTDSGHDSSKGSSAKKTKKGGKSS